MNVALRELRDRLGGIKVSHLGEHVPLKQCCVVSLGHDVVAICNPWNTDLLQIEVAIRHACPHERITVLDNEIHVELI